MKGTPVPKPVKELIIERVKKGEKVDDLASEFSISPNTIRKWLSIVKVSASGNSSNRSDALLISKLQREKQQLLEIIGELTVLTKQNKKK